MRGVKDLVLLALDKVLATVRRLIGWRLVSVLQR